MITTYDKKTNIFSIRRKQSFWSPWLVRVPTFVSSEIQCSWCSTNL